MPELYQEVPWEALRDVFGNACYGSAGLAEGTNAATIQTANPIHYSIAHRNYVKVATDNIALTAAAAQADGNECMYLICINAAGTVSSVKGTEALIGAGVTLPAVPADVVPIGAIKVATDGAAFTAGTTDLGAAEVTDTYYNLARWVPDTF